MTHRERIEQYISEGRTISGGKGDDLVRQQEHSQLDFNKQLMKDYQTSFAQNQGVLNFLQGKMTPLINNPTGYSPTAMTTMRTSASDTNAQQFTNASQALNTGLTARGESGTLPSGVDAQLKAGLAAQGATQEAGSQNEITQANENLKNQNFWNAVNVLNGVGAGYNPNGTAAAFNSGSSNVGSLATSYMNSQQGFGTSFMNSFGSTLGHTLGGGNASGRGGAGGFFGYGG